MVSRLTATRAGMWSCESYSKQQTKPQDYFAIEEVVSEPYAIEAIRLHLLRDHSDRIIRTPAVILAIVRQKYHELNLHCSLTRTFSFKYWPSLAVWSEGNQGLLKLEEIGQAIERLGDISGGYGSPIHSSRLEGLEEVS